MILIASTRKFYEKNAKAQLENWRADLEKMKTKTRDSYPEEEKDGYFAKMDDLDFKYQYSKSKVDELLNSPEHNWEKAKHSYEKVWCEVAPTFYKLKKSMLI